MCKIYVVDRYVGNNIKMFAWDEGGGEIVAVRRTDGYMLNKNGWGALSGALETRL